jgi:hypothetical protein
LLVVSAREALTAAGQEVKTASGYLHTRCVHRLHVRANSGQTSTTLVILTRFGSELP